MAWVEPGWDQWSQEPCLSTPNRKSVSSEDHMGPGLRLAALVGKDQVASGVGVGGAGWVWINKECFQDVGKWALEIGLILP